MGWDWPHAHLLINHFPIIMAVMGATAVIVALVMGWRSAWLYAVASLTVMGLSAYPVVFTGKHADKALNDPWYIVHGVIDKHEAASDWALWMMIATGVVAAYAWWRAVRRDGDTQRPPLWLRVLVLVGALMSLATVTRTALLGGDIVQGSSILQGPAPAGLPPQPPETPGKD